MLINVQIELTEQEMEKISISSLERLLQTADNVAKCSRHYDAWLCRDNIRDIGDLAIRMWLKMQDAIVRKLNPQHFNEDGSLK